MKVISRDYLQPAENVFQKQSLLVRLQSTNESHRLSYRPGDHLGVFPSNAPNSIDELLNHLFQKYPAFSGLEDAVLEVEYSEDNENWITQDRLPPCKLREAFTSYLDITSPPGQRFLASMSLMATEESDKIHLKKLAQEPEQYKQWKMHNFPTLLDTLKEFPSVRITPEFLLSRRSLLAPRLYSISSSLRAHPDEVHLTMSLVQFLSQKNPSGPKKFGVCTSFFDRYPEGTVPCFVRPAPSFRLPEDTAVPIILIGAGSGIAPFRSFWQEREVIANQMGYGVLGMCVLFFGCRSKNVDYLYEEEHRRLLKTGIIDKVFVAYSREDKQKKTYVQDEMYTQRSLVFRLLEEDGAHVYVCGDAEMAEGVRKSLLQVYTSEGSLDDMDAQNAIDDLLNQSRYHEDVFGAIHSF
ncbi:Nitric oxide synthase, brain [Pseudolycoriella hygida]|uniref:nitric-oxide synthase (NADPH) n=1 Tax=Pseudolycoriella hygida TaxID=35572 RepID=A0A9Q0N1J3_9DIPT|nr:Nitric oxide synthase, brain [Pseudolycoriella hygida]